LKKCNHKKSGESLFGDSESSDSLFSMTPEQKQKKAEQSKNSILEKFKENKKQPQINQPISNQAFMTQLPLNNGMMGMGISNQQSVMPVQQVNLNGYGMNPYGRTVNNNTTMYGNSMANAYTNQTQQFGGMNTHYNTQVNNSYNGIQSPNRNQSDLFKDLN